MAQAAIIKDNEPTKCLLGQAQLMIPLLLSIFYFIGGK